MGILQVAHDSSGDGVQSSAFYVCPLGSSVARSSISLCCKMSFCEQQSPLSQAECRGAGRFMHLWGGRQLTQTGHMRGMGGLGFREVVETPWFC